MIDDTMLRHVSGCGVKAMTVAAEWDSVPATHQLAAVVSSRPHGTHCQHQSFVYFLNQATTHHVFINNVHLNYGI